MVATAGGAFLGVVPLVGFSAAGVWLLVFFVFRDPSVASIVVAGSLALWAWFYGYPWPVIAFGGAAGLGVLILHKANLARLWRGEENRSTLGAAGSASRRPAADGVESAGSRCPSRDSPSRSPSRSARC